MATLEFSVSPSKQGKVYATEFTFKKTNLPAFINTTWDFGDGTYAYNQDEVKHSYNYPGIYTVFLSAWSPFNELVVAYDFIDVDYIYRDAIQITNLPQNWDVPGSFSKNVVYVSLTSAKIDEPIAIVLHSTNSKSVPHNASKNKWNFLNPTWKFIEPLSGQPINGPIQIPTTPLYSNNKVVAVSGLAAFYYVDDSPTLGEELNCPVILTATLSTLNFSYPPESLIYPYYSYSNNEIVQAATIWQIRDVIPTGLEITENYINEIYPFKWTGIPIPVMITCTFNPSALPTFQNVSGLSETKLLSYPKNNELGKLNSIDIKLHNYSPSEYVVGNAPLFFQKTDKNNLPIGGYIFTTITPLVSSKGSATFVTASATAVNIIEKQDEFPFPVSYPVDAIAYISHPFENNINKIEIAPYDSACPITKKYKALGLLKDGHIKCIDVPPLYTSNTNNLEVSGASNIYGLSYNPVKRILYGADADKNTICAINDQDQITSMVHISAITNRQYDTPSFVSIDRDSNIWVSLYDSATLIKYDSSLQTVLASAVPVLSAYNLADEEGEPLIQPSVVETDRNNNVWACYSNPLSSLLFKYNTNGVQLTSYSFSYNNGVPTSLAIDKSNQVWVALYNGNKVSCFDTNAKLLSSFDFLKPTYVAADKKSNLWVLHGYNLCSFINTKTRGVSSWKVNTVHKNKDLISSTYRTLASYSVEEIAQMRDTNEIWGGLAVDVFDRVWLVDSENNNVCVFNSKTPNEFSVFGVAPKASQNFIVETNKNYTTKINTSVVRSAQANGDWTGNRWYQKYANEYFTNTISGSSSQFVVNNLDTAFTLAKINDEFDCGKYFKSLALPEILHQNTGIFDNFLPAIVGNGDPTKPDLGRTIYERIANYVINHSDLDTAEIDQLHSLADELNVSTKRYGIDFPSEVNYYLSLFSVPRRHLMGFEKLDPEFANTIGKIVTLNTLISAGQYLYAKDRESEAYQLVFTTRTSAQELIYPLSSLDVNGLRKPIHDNYYFFEYSPSILGYTSNVVNWNSKYTTLSRNLSSDEDWFGDEKAIELYFNNLLTKRLFTK